MRPLNWHWIFFVNLPIGITTAVLATRLLPAETGIGLEHGADAPGALLLVSSLMLAVCRRRPAALPRP